MKIKLKSIFVTIKSLFKMKNLFDNFKDPKTTVIGIILLLQQVLQGLGIETPENWKDWLLIGGGILFILSKDPDSARFAIETLDKIANKNVEKEMKKVKIKDTISRLKTFLLIIGLSLGLLIVNSIESNAQLNYNARRVSLDTLRARSASQGGVTGRIEWPYNWAGTYPSIAVNDTLLHEWIKNAAGGGGTVLAGEAININPANTVNLGGSYSSPIAITGTAAFSIASGNGLTLDNTSTGSYFIRNSSASNFLIANLAGSGNWQLLNRGGNFDITNNSDATGIFTIENLNNQAFNINNDGTNAFNIQNIVGSTTMNLLNNGSGDLSITNNGSNFRQTNTVGNFLISDTGTGALNMTNSGGGNAILRQSGTGTLQIDAIGTAANINILQSSTGSFDLTNGVNGGTFTLDNGSNNSTFIIENTGTGVGDLVISNYNDNFLIENESTAGGIFSITDQSNNGMVIGKIAGTSGNFTMQMYSTTGNIINTVTTSGPVTFADSRTVPRGIEYSGVDMGVFTDNSLVHKAYVADVGSGSLTDGAPTNAQIAAILGSVLTKSNGYRAIIQDTDGAGGVYNITMFGTTYYYNQFTAAP